MVLAMTWLVVPSLTRLFRGLASADGAALGEGTVDLPNAGDR